MSEISRAAFLRRMAAVFGAAYVGVDFAKPVAAEPVAIPPPQVEEQVVEWWAESDSNKAVLVRLMSMTKRHGRVTLELHVIPPKSGIYVQFPLGREPVAGITWIDAKIHGNDGDYIDVPFVKEVDVGGGVVARAAQLAEIPLWAGMMVRR
jgi:hypothetical protein